MLSRTIRKHRFRGTRGAVAAGITLAAVGALIAFAGAGAATVSVADADPTPTTTVTFSYTGGAQFWTVPTGVTSATFDAYGAGGGTGGETGGAGGEATGTVAVSAGQQYQITVGGGGGPSAKVIFSGSGWEYVGGGGFNGGGNGGVDNQAELASGGGGGASDVRFDSTTPCSAASPCGLADRLVVAGGGGGGTYQDSSGGAGGGLAGEPGGSVTGGGTGGGGGTQTMGGAAGTLVLNAEDDYPSDDQPGTLGQGGVGSGDDGVGEPGGGGGGGYYGGGGGAGGHQYEGVTHGGGGGGGSSYVTASATNASTTTGDGAAAGGYSTGLGGNGWVAVTYPTVPDAPTDLTVTPGDSQVTLSWDAPDSAVTGYNIYQGSSAGGESATPVNSSPVTGTSYTVSGLTDGTTYYFEVTAVNDPSGFTGPSEGPPSNETSATPLRSQTISYTSTPPSPAVYGGSYTPTATGGGSGEPVRFNIDSSSANGACAISSSGTVSFTGTGTCVIDANQAAGDGYAAATQAQQSFSIGKAVLTVTANDASRLFGAANPAFTATITGFVNGDTASVVAGQADCTSTAQPWSPAGTYPIACTQGTLAAANYAFTFVGGTLTVGYTGGGCQTGSHLGTLTVASGQALCLGAGDLQFGPVRVAAGGALDIQGATVIGPILSADAAQLRICGAHLTGLVSISGSAGLVVIGDDEGPACAGNTINAPAELTANSGGVEFDHNTVNGALTITGTTGTVPPPDSGSLVDVGNHVNGPIHIS
jgi:hypothetical protein